MKPVRVSAVLARLVDYGHIDAAVLKNKQEIGSDVDEAITAMANGDWMPLLEERRIAYFDSYGQWHEENKPIFVRTHQRYECSVLNLTGEIDAVIQYGNEPGINYLIDYKCSAAEAKSRCGMSIWKMQAHMYGYLLRVNGFQLCDTYNWIQLRTKKVVDKVTGDTWIVGATPKVFSYKYDQDVMDRCIEEVHKYWEEKGGATDFS